MKPVHIVPTEELVKLTELLEGDGFDDAASARKELVNLDVGTYSVLRLVEHNVIIEPPPVTQRKHVVRGETFIDRPTKPKDAKPEAPERGSDGKFK